MSQLKNKKFVDNESDGVFTDSDCYADTDSCTRKVTMDVNGMALKSVLNGCRTHLSWPRSQYISSGNTSQHYHETQLTLSRYRYRSRN